MGNFKEIAKHGGNYLIANLATKALAFISIPVYTRILSTYDYGIVSIFLGVVGILNSLFTLCVDQSVSRYYYDKKDIDDFKKFVGTSSSIATIVFVVNVCIFILFAKPFGELIKLETNVVYLFIPMALINIVGLTFEQIFNPMKQSKRIALSSLVRVYLGFLFSIVLIKLLDDHKYYGQIAGQILAGAVVMIYWISNIRKYFTFSFKKEYFKYILSYSVPLIPYVLSGVIINEFAKITIANVQGVDEVGFYNLALTLSSLVGTIVFVSNQAWTPYYFEYLKTKNYKQHDEDLERIFKITLFIALGISALSLEIGLLLAKKNFTGYLFLVPLLTLAPIMHQISYVYMRNIFYTKKTIYLSVIVFSSGVANILLNIYLIPLLGPLGGAISLVISYILMASLAWFISRYRLSCYTTSPWLMVKSLLLYLPFGCVIFLLGRFDFSIKTLACKLLVLAIFAILISWKEREFVLEFIKKISSKLKK